MDMLSSFATSSVGLLVEGLFCLYVYDRIYKWYCNKNKQQAIPIWTHQIPKAEIVREEQLEPQRRKAA